MKKLKYALIIVVVQGLLILHKIKKFNVDKDNFMIGARKSSNQTIPLLIQFINSKEQKTLLHRLETFIQSIRNTSTCLIDLYIITDAYGKLKAIEIFRNYSDVIINQHFYSLENVINNLNYIIKPFQELFSSEKSYYTNPLFFVSLALHHILPSSINKIIMVDLDTVFLQDIKDLYEIFEHMKPHQLFAMAYEQQPVYYHLLQELRNQNSKVLFGMPSSLGGLPGFNAGVKLFNLDRMRSDKFYNSYLENPQKLKKLSLRYLFKGHLGDQDFFTLLSFFKKDWFYVLPCQWNRQLCTWWKHQGYKKIFLLFHNCTKPYFVLHGNCGSKIPFR